MMRNIRTDSFLRNNK